MTRHSERSVIAFLACLSILLAFGIDAALPAFDEIRDEFDLASGSGEVSLIVTMYFIGMAIAQPFYGTLSDRFGRRPLLLTAIGLFGLGAAGASLAPSFELMLAFRLLWGIGAAGPSVISMAMARDLYSGDQMARVMTVVMAVFLIGPTLAPLAGEGLLVFGSWQLVFVSAVALALLMAAWSIGFGETLPVERRRSIEPAAIARGMKVVVTNRASIFYIGALIFSFGGFFIFLGSSQPIVDEVYGHGEWFAVTFGAISAVNGIGVFAGSRFIKHYGAEAVARFNYAGLVIAYATLALAAVVADGVPSFWIWGALVTVTSTSSTIVTTTCTSLALQPMERIAGTAAAVRGLTTLGLGSVLAAVIDRQIDTTVTPMAVGGLIYSVLGFGLLMWARGGLLDPVDPDTGEPVAFVSD